MQKISLRFYRYNVKDIRHLKKNFYNKDTVLVSILQLFDSKVKKVVNKNINEMIHKYKRIKDPELLSDILYELGNTDLWVPLNERLKEENTKINHISTGVIADIIDDMYYTPNILRSGEKLFFPIFVLKEDAPENYRDSFTWLNMSLNQAAKYTLRMNQIAGIVVNAFSDPFIISREFLEYRANKIKSYIIPKGTEIALTKLDDCSESQKLVLAVKNFVNTDNNYDIRNIYIAVLIRTEEISYLIAVDTKTQKNELLFSEIDAYLKKECILSYPTDYCLFSDTICNEIQRYGIKPIMK